MTNNAISTSCITFNEMTLLPRKTIQTMMFNKVFVNKCGIDIRHEVQNWLCHNCKSIYCYNLVEYGGINLYFILVDDKKNFLNWINDHTFSVTKKPEPPKNLTMYGTIM